MTVYIVMSYDSYEESYVVDEVFVDKTLLADYFINNKVGNVKVVEKQVKGYYNGPG